MRLCKIVNFNTTQMGRRHRSKRAKSSSSAYGTDSVGGQIGGLIGNAAQGFLGRIFGMGDYSLKTNSLFSDGKPSIAGNSEGSSIRVRHSEFLGDVTALAGSTFTPQSFLLNPGNATLFPWFYQLAQCYEEWIPNGLVFEFKSTASTNSTSTNLGSLAFATDYDVYDAAPASRVEMLQMAYSQDNGVTTNQYHGIECDPRMNPLGKFWILKSGEVAQGSSREYSLGITYYNANNAAVSGVVGQLWIHYDITLCKATPSPILTAPVMDRWGGSAAMTAADAFPSAIHTDASFGSLLTSNPNVYTFAPSTRVGDVYLVTTRWIGASTACSTPNITLVNCVANFTQAGVAAWLVPIVGSYAYNTITDGFSLTTTHLTRTLTVRITLMTSLPTITWAAGTLPGTGTSWSLTVVRIGYLAS